MDRLTTAALIAMIFGCNAASADIDIPLVSGAPELDGQLDEAFWAEAATVELGYETRPAENEPASVRTVAYLAENGSDLYVAFRAYDPNPESIVAFLADRDDAYDDDWVGIVLDTFNDQRRAFEFFANPFGIQMDLTFDDVNGNEDDSWNAIWDSKGALDDKGYVVEMRIPFQSLQFPAGDDAKTFGFDLIRVRPRDFRYRLSNNIQDRSVPCYLCQLDKMRGFASADPGRNLIIAPSATAIRTDSASDTDVPEPVLVEGDIEFEPALDVRWGITPDINLTATLNPDFSQVEADVAQVQVNQQFALFFPEQRPFFLEGADFFASPINAVFTRNLADPDFGAKITGKAAGHTFGAFVANDTTTNLLLPGAQGSEITTLDEQSEAAVARYAYDVGRNSRVGALATQRQAGDYRNTVVGVDGRAQFADYYTIEGQFLQSNTQNPESISDEFGLDEEQSGHALRARFERRSRNWLHYAQYLDFGRDFRADMGFVPQVDFDKSIIGMFRFFNPEAGLWWSRASIGGDYDITHDADGQLLERELEMRADINFVGQSYAEIGLVHRDRLFEDTLYEESRGFLYTETQPTGSVFLGLLLSGGDQIDFANSRLGKDLTISPRTTLRLGDGLALRLRHTWQELEADGDRVFTVNLTDLRVQYQMSPRTFFRVVLTHRDVDRNVSNFAEPVDASTRRLSSQLLWSYTINPQTVFFLGYGDSRLEDDTIVDLTEVDRGFFMKVGYAFLP
ncbi:MAG: DUF5916 domain-containing protein [Pseudomonadota bacterium]